MLQTSVRSDSIMERKIISVSTKRQVTIPQKFFEALGFSNEAECILQDNAILIRPIHDINSQDFSEQILSDLIAQGLSGEKLLAKFKEKSRQLRPAVKQLIKEADAMAKDDKGKVSLDELFGAEDK